MNWARVYIEDLTLSLVNFIDWLFVKGLALLFLCCLVFWAFSVYLMCAVFTISKCF